MAEIPRYDRLGIDPKGNLGLEEVQSIATVPPTDRSGAFTGPGGIGKDRLDKPGVVYVGDGSRLTTNVDNFAWINEEARLELDAKNLGGTGLSFPLNTEDDDFTRSSNTDFLNIITEPPVNEWVVVQGAHQVYAVRSTTAGLCPPDPLQPSVGDRTLQISYRTPAIGALDFAFAYWDVQWTSDQESRVQLCLVSDGTTGARDTVAVRINKSATATTQTCYVASFDNDSSGSLRLSKMVGGTRTALGGPTVISLQQGDWIIIRAVGTTIKVIRERALVETEVISVTDSAIANGVPGLAHAISFTAGSNVLLNFLAWQAKSLGGISPGSVIPARIRLKQGTIQFDEFAEDDVLVLDSNKQIIGKQLSTFVGGSGANGRVAFWTGASTLSSDAQLTYDPTADELSVPLVQGGAASGGNFTLRSTSNPTKGKILIGTSAYDEVNNRLGIGLTVPIEAIHVRGTTTGKAILDSTVNTSFSALQFYENDVFKSTIQHLNSNFVTAARRNSLELYNLVTGAKITFHVNNQGVPEVSVANGITTFGGVVDVGIGYRITGGAGSGSVLRGNGTNFVSAQLLHNDLGGVTANQHHDENHVSRHVSGGADPFTDLQLIDAQIWKIRKLTTAQRDAL
jgi:hypothetical protein